MQDDDILRLRLIKQWVENGVPHVTAIPVILAFNFNRLKDLRQAGRGKNHVWGNLFGMKYPGLASAHIGCADK